MFCRFKILLFFNLFSPVQGPSFQTFSCHNFSVFTYSWLMQYELDVSRQTFFIISSCFCCMSKLISEFSDMHMSQKQVNLNLKTFLT